MTPSPPRVLCIGGSDSSGGAGIQADIRTALALGAHALTAVTAVTAQDSTAVHDRSLVPPDVIAAQIRAVVDDCGVDAVKIGMLGTADAVDVVAEALAGVDVPIVLDPVCRASSGGELLDAAGVTALAARLLPLATVVTPNLDELRALTGAEDVSALLGLGPSWVLLTGLHRGDLAVDRLDDGASALELTGPWIETPHGHGTGCTLATAIAVGLARGESVPDAVRRAKDYVRGALEAAYPLGSGPGPLGHAWSQGQP